MNFQEAVAEVQRIKSTANLSEYVGTLSLGAKTKVDLPDSLDAAHSALTLSETVLNDSNANNAKMATAVCIGSDKVAIDALVKDLKVSPAAATKLSEWVDRKRAQQMVFLAEGDPTNAGAGSEDIQQILQMLGQLPASVATDAPDSAGPGDPTGADGPDPTVPAVQPDPTDTAGQSDDEKLDAKAQEIMKRDGCDYHTAALQAEKELGGAGASPVGATN